MSNGSTNTPFVLESLDYRKDIHLAPSYILEGKIRTIKQRINEHLPASVMENLERLEQIFEMFDILVLLSPNYVCVYNKEGNPLLLNPAFLNLVGCEEEEIIQMISRGVSLMKQWYKGENLEKVQRYMWMIQNGEIDGYRNVSFVLTDKEEEEHSILWSNFRIHDGTNIRIGTEVTPEYGAFFKEEILPAGTCKFGENFPISKRLVEIYNYIQKNTVAGQKLCHELCDSKKVKGDVQYIFQNARLMGLMIDFMIREASTPITMYDGNTPILLNNAFLIVSGYSREQVMQYYKEHKEVSTLFYKGEDLENVKKKLASIGQTHRNGYKDIEFTMTRNPEKGGERITMAWTTYNWVNNKTLRSARFIRIEK